MCCGRIVRYLERSRKKRDPASLLYSQPETGRSKVRLTCERKDGPQRNTRTSPKPRRATHGEVDYDRAVWDLARGRPHLRLQQNRQPQGPHPTLFVSRQEHSSVHRDPGQGLNYEFLQLCRLHRTLALDRELHAAKQRDHSWGREHADHKKHDQDGMRENSR